MRIFNETQRFNQWWLQLINIGLLGVVLFCSYNWYIMKESAPEISTDATIIQLLIIASIIPILILFYVLKLNTTIDEIGVHYQFLPFHFSKKTVRWNELEKCYVRAYSPIKEYGGWGYRGSFGKKRGSAFNVKGNKGIQLQFKDGKKLLIGTQKEKDAQQVINRYFNREA